MVKDLKLPEQLQCDTRYWVELDARDDYPHRRWEDYSEDEEDYGHFRELGQGGDCICTYLHNVRDPWTVEIILEDLPFWIIQVPRHLICEVVDAGEVDDSWENK